MLSFQQKRRCCRSLLLRFQQTRQHPTSEGVPRTFWGTHMCPSHTIHATSLATSSHVHTATVKIILRNPQPTNPRRQPFICNLLPDCHAPTARDARISVHLLQAYSLSAAFSHISLSASLSHSPPAVASNGEKPTKADQLHTTHRHKYHTLENTEPQWLPADMHFVSPNFRLPQFNSQQAAHRPRPLAQTAGHRSTLMYTHHGYEKAIHII